MRAGEWAIAGTAAKVAAPIEAPEAQEARFMSGFQLRAVAICMVLQMLDGFDVLVMSFTAPAVSLSWGLSGSQLGALLSAGLVGMAGGSLLVAPLADHFGRRPLSLLCLGAIALGMLLSALAGSAVELAALRVVTGVGVGGMVASLNVITAEYASERWRGAALGLQATGYPIGATLGGWISTLLIARLSWRSAFVFGGLASALMIPVVVRCLPESMDFLVVRRPANALVRLNALRRRMRRAPLDALPEPPAAQAPRSSSSLLRLLAGLPARSAVPLCISFFLAMLGVSFVQSWTPKLLIQGGLSVEQGLTAGVLLNLGGILGGAIVVCCAARLDLRHLEYGCLALGALCMALFGRLASELAWALGIAFTMGVCLSAVMVGLCALGPSLYPAQVRTTGMGISIGMGRIAAILSPLGAGFLLDAGWQSAQLYYAFALPIAAALVSVRALFPRS